MVLRFLRLFGNVLCFVDPFYLLTHKKLRKAELSQLCACILKLRLGVDSTLSQLFLLRERNRASIFQASCQIKVAPNQHIIAFISVSNYLKDL